MCVSLALSANGKPSGLSAEYTEYPLMKPETFSLSVRYYQSSKKSNCSREMMAARSDASPKYSRREWICRNSCDRDHANVRVAAF